MSDATGSSSDTEPQLLLESGPMLLRDFNPKGVLRFAGRKCVTCGNEIMDHWLRDSMDASLKGLYWCSKDGNQFSRGITDCQYDVPEGFGQSGSDKEQPE
jgi:hypothetical protein